MVNKYTVKEVDEDEARELVLQCAGTRWWWFIFASITTGSLECAFVISKIRKSHAYQIIHTLINSSQIPVKIQTIRALLRRIARVYQTAIEICNTGIHIHRGKSFNISAIYFCDLIIPRAGFEVNLRKQTFKFQS